MSVREIDDPYKRLGGKNSYKKQRFDEKKSMKDDYTGDRIFSDQKSHTMETSADIDHIVPLAVVKKRYSDLTKEQQKKIANSYSNYAVTSATLNRSKKSGKNDLQNHEYVAKYAKTTASEVTELVKKKEIDAAAKKVGKFAKTSSKMIGKEAQATVVMETQATGYRAENLVFRNEHGGRELAQSTEVKSIIYHGREIILGREDFEEASVGIVTDLACVKVENYVTTVIEEKITSGTIKVVEHGADIVIEKTNDEIVKQLMGKISGNAGKIAAIVAKAGKCLIQCVAGEMTVEQFAVSSIKTGVDIANTIIGAEAGKLVGELIGGAIGSVIPVVGTGVGAVIGRFVGEFVGALLGSEFLNICLSVRSEADIFLESQRELAYEIDRHTYRLMQNLYEIHVQHEANIMDAFHNMYEGIVISDFEKVNQAIGMVTKEFGFKLAYDNQDDFDSFMLDDKQSVKLGKVVMS